MNSNRHGRHGTIHNQRLMEGKQGLLPKEAFEEVMTQEVVRWGRPRSACILSVCLCIFSLFSFLFFLYYYYFIIIIYLLFIYLLFYFYFYFFLEGGGEYNFLFSFSFLFKCLAFHSQQYLQCMNTAPSSRMAGSLPDAERLQ